MRPSSSADRPRGDHKARSTEDLVLQFLRTRPAVWAAAMLASGVAIATGIRHSLLLALPAAIATSLVVAGLIALYDVVAIGRHGSAFRSREVRARRLKALVTSVLVASLAAAMLLLVFAVVLWLFEPRDSGQPPVSGNTASGRTA